MNPPAVLRLAVAVFGVLIAVGMASTPARAHGDDGTFEVTAATPTGDLIVTYDVLLTYINDGEPADGATVTLAADGPDGATIGPIPLTPTGQPRHYAAAVTFPAAGQWQIRLSALSPTALLERADTIAGGTSTTAAGTTTTTTTTTSTSAAAVSTTTTTAPSTTSTAPPTSVRSTTTSTPGTTSTSTPEPGEADDNGSSAGLIVGGIAGAAAVGGIALVLVRRRPVG